MKKLLSAFLFAVTAIGFTSCVSNSKFKASEAMVQQLQTDLGSCKTNLSSESAATTAANAKISDLNGQVSSLTAQNAALAPDAAAYRAYMKEHKEQREMLDAHLAEKGTSVEEIQAKIVAGFSQLIDSGINITLQNGFLYVDLPEKLLFAQGSSKLSMKSSDALSPLASVLNNYPRVQIYVIGHTDTLKINNAFYQDNWSLSTERANSIVRVLRDKYSVDPARLLASGKSKYAPIASNATKEGRALNRRIQIIIDPNLRGIWVEAMMAQ